MIKKIIPSVQTLKKAIMFATLVVVASFSLPAIQGVQAAAPQVVGTQTSFRDSNDTSDVITLPTSVAAGDLIIVFHISDGSQTKTWPSPWVELEDTDCNSPVCNLGVAYLVASGGETSVTVTKSAGERFTAIALRISAASWHGTSAPEISTGVTGASANPDPDSVTASWGSADNLFIALAAWDPGVSTVSSYPTNYSSNQIKTPDTLSAASGALATRELTAASDNPGTFTTDNDDWWAGTIVVRPAAAGPTPTPTPTNTPTPTPTPTNTPTPTPTPVPGSPVYVGIDTDGTSNAWPGSLKGFTVYNYARSADQIKADALSASAPQLAASLGEFSSDFLQNGLVGHWKMDEGVGSTGPDWTAIDSSGNGNNGTGMGDAGLTNVKYGNGGSFDGAGDYLLLNSELALGSVHSICVWANPSSVDTGPIVAKESTTEYALKFYGSSSRIYYRVGGTAYDFAYTVDDELHFFCQVRDNDVLYTYRDGVLLNTLTGMGSNTLTIDRIGRDDSASEYNGTMDELRIYNRALKPSEVNALYNYAPGPVAYWRMDERVSGDSQTIYDSSGNGLDGTTSDAGGSGMNCRISGKFGGACQLDGVDDYISVGDAAALDITSPFTISGWIKPPQGGSTATFQNGFESGDFTGWDSGTTATPATRTVTALAVKNGTYGARFDVNQASDNAFQAYVNDNFSSNTKTYLRAWVNFSSFTSAGYDAATSKAVMSIWANGTRQVWLSIGNNGGTPTLALNYQNASTDTKGTEYDLTEGSWHEVIMMLDRSQGGPITMQWWLDGTSKQQINVASPSGTGIATNQATYWARYGIVHMNSWEKGVYTIDIDDAGHYTEYPVIHNGSILSKGTDAYALRYEGTELKGYANSSNTVSSTLTENAWKHISYVYDGTNQSLYVDGQLESTNSFSSSVSTNATDISIGSDFAGSIDDLKIYNYARTHQQVVSDMNGGHPAPGSPVGSAVLHYRLDEGYGTTVNNVGNAGSTLNGTFGTGNSAPTWTNDGKYGKALSFDGTDDYISVPSTSDFPTIQGEKTISLWMKPDTYGTTQSWFTMVNGTNSVQIGILSNNISVWKYGDTTLVSAVSPSSAGEWVHAVYTYDETNHHLYLNGVLQASSTVSSQTASPSSVYISTWDGSTQPIDGQIDEVKIYNFALTTDQVKAEFNQGKAIVLGSLSTGSDGSTASWAGAREYCVPGDTSTCDAPVGHWTFNEGVGSTAYDSSGNGYNGSLVNSVSWIKGKIGGGINTNGSSQYVNISDPADGNLDFNATDNGTFTAWVRSSTANSDVFLYKGFGGGDPGYRMRVASDGDATCGIADNAAETTEVTANNTAINDGEWHHVACVIGGSGTTLSVYVDGVYYDQITDSEGSIESAKDLEIGYASSSWPGDIDDVRIYRYARTPAQIAWEYNQGAPIAWYRMDEGSETTINNAAKNGNGQTAGNNGTLTIGGSGSQTTTTQAWTNGATGKYSGSLSFDGSDDSISIGSSLSDSITNEISISAWVKSDVSTSGGHMAIVTERYNSDGNVEFQIGLGGNGDTDSFVAGFYNGAWRMAIDQSTIDTDVWYHLVGTYDGSTIKLYKNGALVASTSYSGSIPTGTDGWYIGRRHDSAGVNNHWNGLIDEVKIFNYVLTPAQIKTDMAHGAVRFQ